MGAQRSFIELCSFEGQGKPKCLKSVDAQNTRGSTVTLTNADTRQQSVEEIVLTGNAFQKFQDGLGDVYLEVITDNNRKGYISYAECDIELPEGLEDDLIKECVSRQDDNGILQDRRRLALINRLLREEG